MTEIPDFSETGLNTVKQTLAQRYKEPVGIQQTSFETFMMSRSAANH